MNLRFVIFALKNFAIVLVRRSHTLIFPMLSPAAKSFESRENFKEIILPGWLVSVAISFLFFKL
jgi:hypothetical protein